ncbi:MAG: hypothetical protein ABI725_06210 [Chloroflexota bacterium]
MTPVRTRGQIAIRGVFLALVVAAILGLIVFGAAQLVGATLGDGIQAAAVVALGYLLLNLLVLAIGLLFKPSSSWAVGAALATPVIVAAIGFGYTIFLSYPL